MRQDKKKRAMGFSLSDTIQSQTVPEIFCRAVLHLRTERPLPGRSVQGRDTSYEKLFPEKRFIFEPVLSQGHGNLSHQTERSGTVQLWPTDSPS